MPEEQPVVPVEPVTDPQPTDPPVEPTPTPAPTPAPPTDPAPSDPPADPTKPETFSREYVEQLRTEAADYRKKAQAAADTARTEFAQEIGKAIGLVKDDKPADPATLLAQVEADRASALEDAAATKRELAVVRSAEKHDAKVDELLDSRDFSKKLAGLDPTADDFATQVETLIKATVDGNPVKFKRVQMPAGTGHQEPTGEGAGAQLTREQFAALSPEERLKAHREGRITGLLGS